MKLGTLGQLIREARFSRGLTLGEIARLLGATTPKRISKVAAEIFACEQTGSPPRPELLSRVIDVLGIEPVTVKEIVDDQQRRDREQWELWASEVVRPYALRKLMATIWIRSEIPDALLEDRVALIRFASELTEGKFVALKLSRRETLWFDPDGNLHASEVAEFERPSRPQVRIGNDQAESLFQL